MIQLTEEVSFRLKNGTYITLYPEGFIDVSGKGYDCSIANVGEENQHIVYTLKGIKGE